MSTLRVGQCHVSSGTKICSVLSSVSYLLSVYCVCTWTANRFIDGGNYVAGIQCQIKCHISASCLNVEVMKVILCTVVTMTTNFYHLFMSPLYITLVCSRFTSKNYFRTSITFIASLGGSKVLRRQIYNYFMNVISVTHLNFSRCIVMIYN